MKHKKLLWLLLLIPAVIVCVVVFREPALREPPDLLVRSDEEVITVSGSATSWAYRNFGGWSEYESGLKPISQEEEYPELETAGKTVTLEFDVEPDRLLVSRHWISETETVEWNWRLDGNEVELGLGKHLYEITANWSREDRTWGGSAVYRFWATGREESLPSASVAPLEFHSLDELAAAVVNSEANSGELAGLSHYYVPTIPDIDLDSIRVKERYLCTYYHVGEMDEIDRSDPDEAEITRISGTVKLEWVRNADGNALLADAKEAFDLKELREGVYYCDITYPTKPDTVLSKSLFWVHDGDMFILDIPLAIYEALIAEHGTLDAIVTMEKVLLQDGT